MVKTTFGIIGCGWRAQFYLRVAAACPDLFEAVGVVGRDEQKAHAFAADWHTTAFASAEQMIHQARPDFVVVSVPPQAAPDVLRALSAAGMKFSASFRVETMAALTPALVKT